MNYRGSGGYGKNFMEKAYKEWGGMIMDDIADATKQIQDEYGLSRNDTCAGGASFGGYPPKLAPPAQVSFLLSPYSS